MLIFILALLGLILMSFFLFLLLDFKFYVLISTFFIVIFELFEIKIRPTKDIKGIVLEEKELFPKDKDFGKTAWTICDLDKALAKFNELENE